MPPDIRPPSVSAEFAEHQSRISLQHHAHAPAVDKEQQRVTLQIHDPLHVGSSLDLCHIHLAGVVHPADLLIGQLIQLHLYIVLILQAVSQHLKLQFSHYAHDDLLHARVVLLEDLDGALLGDLVHTF